jgi:Pro-kumamolisin, activation domain/Bacterial Ig-like domain (group 3)
MTLLRAVLRPALLFGIFLCQIHVQPAMGQVGARVVDAVDDARRITLTGNVHPLARAEFDRGTAADSLPMNRMLLLLKRSDAQEAALQSTLAGLQDKSLPGFHQWLTPAQFGAQFGPADADIQAVTDWLTRQGFSVGKIYSGKTVIEFSGNAGQVQRAFDAAIHNYQVNGKAFTANASDPQIPAALAPVIAGVVTLHNFPRDFYARRFGVLRRSAGKSVAEPLVTMPNPFGPGSFYGVGPGDFAKIYGVPATCGSSALPCNGAGQTIAIVGETNLVVSDVQQFRSVFGLPAMFNASSIVYNGEDPGITTTDEEGEADLDTEWSGGVAPGATIKYVLSASTSASQGVDLSALYIVDNNLAGVMSESYGQCESGMGTAENSFYNNLWQQASAQGITVAVSTGDSGSAGCDDPHTENLAASAPGVNGIASTPYNVAVGGTDFDEYGNWTKYWSSTNAATTGASALGYIPEIPWNQSCAQLGATGCNINTTPPGLQNIVAGGGGPSTIYTTKPSWQVGIAGMPADGKRDLPDISLLASPGFNGTGYLYCQGDVASACVDSSGFNGSITFGVIGGTSASAPAFAGIMALLNQSQATTLNPSPRQGNANYVLYELANKSSASCASATPVVTGCVFNDISKGSSALPTGGTGIGTISVPCSGSSTDGCSVASSTLIGVLDDPSNPGTMAWNAGVGYDRATGLGSLNVGNLITSWGTVASVPTTTTLTLSQTTGITHGSENVTTISVKPQSGTAKGTVSLLAQPTAGSTVSVGEFTLGANGSVSGTSTNLPGGNNYAVYAHYSGDGINAPSDSASVTVSVTPEISQTFIVIPSFDASGNQLSGNTTSVTYGSSYIIRMYVTDKNGVSNPSGAPIGSCSQANPIACPSGTITLTSDGALVDTGGGGAGIYNLNGSGYTRDLSPNLPGGAHALAANYSGDSSYVKSTGTATLTVNQAATQTQIDSYLPRPVLGQTFQLEANVSSQPARIAAYPGGTVTFYDGNTQLPGPVQITKGANGQIYADIYNISFSSPGPHTITAQYSGDTNYTASTSSPVTVSALIPTSIKQSESATSINYGQSVTFTAVLTSSAKGPAITGQVFFQGTFPNFTNVVTTPGTDANGNQMLTVTGTTVPPGTEGIFSLYQGDPNYAPSSTPADLITVNIPDFTLTPPAGISATLGQSGSGILTITPASTTPSPVTLSVSGLAPPGTTLTVSPTTVNLAGTPVQVTLTLSATGSATGATVKSQIRKAGVLGVARGNWWGVSFVSAVAFLFLIGMPARKRRYRAIFSLGLLCVATFALGCGGGGGPSGSSSSGGGGGTPTPTPTPTSITVTSSNAKIAQGGSVTLTANVTATQAITGGVVFYQNGNPISSAIPVVNSQSTFTLTNSSGPGIFAFTAGFNGDAKNQPSSTATGVTEEFEGSVPIQIQAATGTLSHSAQIQLTLQ